MNESTLRNTDRLAFLSILVVCLAPLVPYALRTLGA
jgi:hypothetical protein